MILIEASAVDDFHITRPALVLMVPHRAVGPRYDSCGHWFRGVGGDV